MDWNLIQLFVDVVDAGSMSEAARRRGMTRSAVSQRLKLLESQASAQLLRRTTRELAPTDIGHLLYEHGTRIATQIEAAQFEVASRTQKLSGLVRISLPFGFGLRFVSPLLRRFVYEHPDVTLRVMFNNRLANLIEAEIDIAIKVANQVSDDVVARDVGTIRWHFYCTPQFARQLGPCEAPDALTRAPFLSPHEGRQVSLQLFSRSGARTVVLTPRIGSENTLFLLDCALADMGVALLPAYLGEERCARGELLQLLPGWHSDKNGGRLFIVTMPNRYPTPAAQAVIEMLRTELPPLLGGGPPKRPPRARESRRRTPP